MNLSGLTDVPSCTSQEKKVSLTLILGVLLIGIAVVVFATKRNYNKSAKQEQAKYETKLAEYEAKRQQDPYQYNSSSKPEPPGSTATVGLLAVAAWTVLIIGSLLVGLNFTTTVSANTVAVEVSFGKPVGVLTPGWHTKAPWVTTEEFSTKLQNSNRLASTNEGDKAASDCITVKANGVSACVDAAIAWAINYDPKNEAASVAGIMHLWRSYGNFDAIQTNVIRRKTETAFTTVYGKYQPQKAYSGTKTAEIGKALTDELSSELVSYGIRIEKFAPGQTHLDQADQDRMNRLYTADQDLQIAKKMADTATQQAKANDNLAKSLTPEILAQRCIDAAKEIKPAVFNCLSNSSSTPVIIDGKQGGSK